MFPLQIVHLKIVSPSNVAFYLCIPRKWYALKSFPLKWLTLPMFPSHMVRRKIVSRSNGPLYPCFPRKWYALKSFSGQMVHFIHVSLANGMA